MREDFIPAAEGYRKLKFAYDSHAAVYMYGATGYGKTRLVREYTEGKEVRWLSPEDSEWDLSEIGHKEMSYVVVDEVQLIKEEEQKKALLALAKRKDVWLVMTGRIQTPLWLMPLVADGHLIIITEENLRLSSDEVERIAQCEGVTLTKEEADRLTIKGKGNALVIASVIQMMKSGMVYNEDVDKKMHDAFINHIENDIIPQWSSHLQEFLMQLSVVDEFTLPLAVMITGDNYASAMLDQTLSVGNFLIRDGEVYYFREEAVEAFRSRAMKVFGIKKYHQYVNNAGLYYEMMNDYEMALKLYEMAGNHDGIKSILIRSARRHPGAINIHALRKYYLELDKEDIESSPVLMSVMSMLYSIMMNPDKSEYWYEKLKTYAASVKGGAKREADEQLLYLDIGLPHRGSHDLIDILKRCASLMKKGGLTLPEFSITSNLPSTMNGGKDFCNWSKRDEFLADTIGKLVEKLMGPMGRGLVHAALCESFYEKGGRDDEVMRHAIMNQMEVDSGGKTELLFATVGIQIRLALLAGNIANAISLLDSFEERVVKEKLDNMLPNIAALRCRIALVAGNTDDAKDWMAGAPNEQMEFWAMDRYRYLTKARCYLAFGQNTEAIQLLERLLYYADINQRTYIRMESGLLMAMALRQEKRAWKEIFLKAINEVQAYNFVRIISEKGAGILPLLKEVRRDYLLLTGADQAWFERVVKETKKIAERYPGYLVSDTVQLKDFGETALAVLKMQANGMSIRAIAEELDLSERTVKYHAAENYRKLDAKGKTDAVQIARNLNII